MYETASSVWVAIYIYIIRIRDASDLDSSWAGGRHRQRERKGTQQSTPYRALHGRCVHCSPRPVPVSVRKVTGRDVRAPLPYKSSTLTLLAWTAVHAADDTGWNDLGFRNPLITSPNLDNLAKHGVVLTRHHAFKVRNSSLTSSLLMQPPCNVRNTLPSLPSRKNELGCPHGLHGSPASPSVSTSIEPARPTISDPSPT